jgi:hypothetical protein
MEERAMRREDRMKLLSSLPAGWREEEEGETEE